MSAQPPEPTRESRGIRLVMRHSSLNATMGYMRAEGLDAACEKIVGESGTQVALKVVGIDAKNAGSV